MIQSTTSQLKTQKERVLDRIKEIGYIDNLYCINNGIWRLSAIIKDLTEDGYEFAIREFAEGTKNYHYYPSNLKEMEDKKVNEKIEKLKRWADMFHEILFKAYKNGEIPNQRHLDVLNEMNKPLKRKQWEVVYEEIDGVIRPRFISK